ncbi:MAG: hypothetical protein HQK51_13395 [Oligoflexia bacterium]|nr:hypothetical protein [Oligoflexia bacterium]
MTTTKIIAFAASAELEIKIKKYAKAEKKTVNEYIRDTICKHILITKFKNTHEKVRKKIKSKKLKSSVVDDILNTVRKKSHLRQW